MNTDHTDLKERQRELDRIELLRHEARARRKLVDAMYERERQRKELIRQKEANDAV